MGEEGWGFDQTSDQISQHLDKSGDQIPSYNPCSGQEIILWGFDFSDAFKGKNKVQELMTENSLKSCSC